jgi:hypothetical protein
MNTKAVPAHIRPMLKALPVRPERLSASVTPITTKPARLSRLNPEMISLVSTARTLPRFYSDTYAERRSDPAYEEIGA